MKYLKLLAAVLSLCALHPADAETLRIQIDADFSVNDAGGEAIEMGVRTALEEVGFEIGGIQIELFRVDHHGNTRRSTAHLEAAIADPFVLAVIGGVHSPPYLANRDRVNEAGLPLLLPWSAAGAITRAEPGATNWIFRLSVDDTKSARFLVDEAVVEAGCARVALLLLDSGWGRANRRPLTEMLIARGMPPPVTEMIPVDLGDARVATIVDQVAESRADCAILLANSSESAAILPHLHARMPDFRIISHWGLIAGGFIEMAPNDFWRSMDIEILTTCGLEAEAAGNATLRDALARIPQEDGTPVQLGAIRAFPGFVHGYDLTRLLIAAIEQIEDDPAWISGDIGARRAALRNALERIEGPVPGILKTYRQPFRPYTPDDPDAHEALGADDLCMARYDVGSILRPAHAD